MKVKDIAETIEKIVPLKLAQGWDNTGLLIGDLQADAKKILLTIDVTREVAAEAKKLRMDLIISYHPIIWDGLKEITADGPTQVVYDLIRGGISVYSIHTALDSAVGGINDYLAEIVGIRDARPIGDYVVNPAGRYYKLVVFVPTEAAGKVSEAIFAAGAGAIGNYSNCGFRSAGQGSFRPLAGARPALGKKGKLTKVPEIRFETTVAARELGPVIAAMRKAHPYETPAFDVIKLYDVENKFGLGRIGKLAKPKPLAEIIERIKKHTGAKTVGMVGKQKRMVKTAAVCAGACGKIINAVIAAKCDLYLTGELKHHQALAAQQAGLSCLCLSHTVSERFILKKFAKQLQKELKQVKIKVSEEDADPFNWKKV